MYTLGIDLHKKSSLWILIGEQRTELFKESVPVHPKDISIALKKIHVPLDDIQVAIEPVCGYRWVTKLLEEAGMKVHIAHPRKVQLIAQSTKKNDTEDARTLANLLQSGFFPEAHKASEEIYKLRLLLRERTFIVRMRTGVKNQLHGIATTQGLHTIKGANPLHKKGKVGIMASDNFVMKELHYLNEVLEKRIAPFDEKLAEEIKKYPTAALLMSVPGVGIVTALTIMAEVDDFSRFATPEKLTRYAGLVPRERSSGGVVKHGGITCEGSAPLRTVLVESAMRIREDNAAALYAFVKRLTLITGAKKARVALARKMLSIMWKMVKDNKPYNKDILSFSNTTKVSDLEARTDA